MALDEAVPEPALFPALRLAHVDGALAHCRESGTPVPLASFESARNHLAAVVDDYQVIWEENTRLRMELEKLTPREVICPVCEQPRKLTANGLIRYHGPHPRPCKGSGTRPETAPASSRKEQQ